LLQYHLRFALVFPDLQYSYTTSVLLLFLYSNFSL
jgi:hypothetical protein